MLDLTGAQQRALRWLYNRTGSGMFTRGQVLLANGELAGVMRATWNALRDAKMVAIAAKRVDITETGEQYCRAHTGIKEAACVPDDDD
jgi:hypothetical protein